MTDKPAGDNVLRACRTCLYWRIGLIVVVATLLATLLGRWLSG
ncbi:MAG TPA: hypothetical protein VGA65_02200 [Hyphomicrobium sp.]|jgi:hypothetical protein